MKRKPAANADPSHTKKQPRQDPVSCESCRKKKLKCDRNLPCSSCTTRKLPCNYTSHETAPSSYVKQGSQTDEQPSWDNKPVSRPLHSTPIIESRSRNRDDPLMTAEWLETILMGHRVPSIAPAPLKDELSQYSRVAAPQQTHISGSLLSLVRGARTASHENPATVHLPSFLPTKAEAMSLLQYYCNHLDWQYHIIIPSQTKRDICTLYERIACDDFDLQHLALLFAIVATALFYQLLSSESADFAEVCSRETAFLAGAALIQSNYVAYPSIEGLQATMIIGHHLSVATLSPSVSSLFLHGTFISQAKSLGLHTVDAVTSERNLKGCDRSTVELKRRLWWDLASYDWYVA